MDVLVVGGGDEVIVPSGTELQTPRGRGEAPERDGEVHEGLRLVADSDYPGSRVHHAAGVELLLLHAVDDVLLRRLGARLVDRADQVDLVVLGRQVTFVHRYSLRLGAETSCCCVPVDVPNFTPTSTIDQ